jgi:hypothetical protein
MYLQKARYLLFFVSLDSESFLGILITCKLLQESPQWRFSVKFQAGKFWAYAF